MAGVVHWWEDRYLTDEQSLEFLASVSLENKTHHVKPTAMTMCRPWENMRSAAPFSWPLALLLWWVNAPTVVWLAVFFSTFGNLVHRYAHLPKRRVPNWIQFMQSTGLFISPEHHDTHHRSNGKLIPKNQASIAYCPMTDWVNPLLDHVKFWDCCERVLRGIGVKTV